MTLDELARQAAADVRIANRDMTIEAIETVRRRHRLTIAVPTVAVLAAGWIGLAVLAFPEPTEPPVVTDGSPTTTTRATETTAGPIEQIVSRSVTEADLDGLPTLTESIVPLADLVDPCCVVVGPSGEAFVLATDSLTSVAEGVRTVARWGDMDATSLVATSSGVIIGGIGADGPQLRALHDDGSIAWTSPIDVDITGALLALDADGVIWAGLDGVLPSDAGFAGVQWFTIATVDGRAVVEERRSTLRPLPDGRQLGLTPGSVTVSEIDGSGIEWQLPTDLRAISADPFLDGVVVTAIRDSDATAGQMVVLSLQPASTPLGVYVDRVWGAVPPGTANTAAGPGTVVGISTGDEGPFLSTAPLDRLVPLPPLVLGDVQWVTGSYDHIADDRGRTLAWVSPSIAGRNTAWDGDEGLVATQPGGILWITPDGTTEVDLPLAEIDIVDAALVGARHVIGVRPVGGPGAVSWYELETGSPVDPPAGARTSDGEIFSAGGRTATILDPDWSAVARDESGGPIPPYDLPQLVVTEGDREVLRIPVGTEARPYVDIHDFDGRRLVIAALPQEPAWPPTTVWIIDLECSDCTRVVDTGTPQWFDLIGTLQPQSDVVAPELP